MAEVFLEGWSETFSTVSKADDRSPTPVGRILYGLQKVITVDEVKKLPSIGGCREGPSRLKQVPIDECQKGFREVNGCSENSLILNTLIKIPTKNNKKRRVAIAFIDLSNTFDSVSHESLLKACERSGVPPLLLKYFGGCVWNSGTCVDQVTKEQLGESSSKNRFSSLNLGYFNVDTRKQRRSGELEMWKFCDPCLIFPPKFCTKTRVPVLMNLRDDSKSKISLTQKGDPISQVQIFLKIQSYPLLVQSLACQRIELHHLEDAIFYIVKILTSEVNGSVLHTSLLFLTDFCIEDFVK
ncbi:unnamed protein product [Lepeophtheirus salmonis]|uniref:(salmon louse) hypothetical protein n=1 Tax=Lepeophtheirus salmonis TaxID=72036 RepID=A0A7R8H8Q7_LEPSM|nr:unnamed protein product [Lepeophtheirus salmonis]CAF2927148.1 unnamed protein product [Lepeophtheirus salmonis]